MLNSPVRLVFLTCAVGALTACGGGSVNSTPGPIVSPPPPPPPPVAQAPFGVVADTEFVTEGDVVSLKWIAAQNAYALTMPGHTSDILEFGGTPNGSELHYGRNGLSLMLRTDLDYSYTNYAVIVEGGWGYPVGELAFGLPTAEGDVPVSGSASYEAEVHGGDGQINGEWDFQPHNYTVGGNANLTFDFGEGTLSGHFDPTLYNYSGEEWSLGRYTFVNTVFGVGNTAFSGDLQHVDFTDLGSFEGSFTGPQAAELLSRWQVPYLNPWSNEQGSLHGIWIGRKRD